MTNFLLFVIGLLLSGIGITLHCILKELRRINDFSKEDAKVKAMTKRVKEAKERLPKQEN